MLRSAAVRRRALSDAVTHAGARCALRLENRGRSDPEILMKDAAEMRGAREAPGKGDIGNRLSAVRLQLLPAILQPRPPDVVTDRHASFAEQHVQVALGAAERS